MFAVSSLSVVVGDLNIKKTTRYTVKRNIKKVYPHSKYNPKTIQNDIAIMEVRSTYQNILEKKNCGIDLKND